MADAADAGWAASTIASHAADQELVEPAKLPEFLQFWAKSGPPGNAAPMHSIAHHGLDVAASAFVLLETWRPPVAVPAAALAALIACHDVGKFTRPFQAKVAALWPAALGPFHQPPPGYPHDEAGFLLLVHPLAQRLDPLFARWRSSSARLPLLRAVAGHHGRPPHEYSAPLPRSVACPTCIDAAEACITALFTAIDPPPLPPLAAADRNRLAWFLAGLAVLADWLGSAWRWFPPVGSAEPDLAHYWRALALPQARRAVAAAGLLPVPAAAAAGLDHLFPGLAAPRPVQEWAGRVRLPAGPALFVIEDATGSGKTEAALLLAQRLMETGRADGLFFALPTMATADAMYARLADAYARLFLPSDRPPSLVLAHGRRALNPHFSASILEDGADASIAMAREPADQPASAQCAAWIADDRRKVFLAEVGVGTIDQALLAVLPDRHAPLRLLGLTRRVLIIDEAHAYDAYMFEELRRLLAFHAALGGSAILLSATLTAEQRGSLACAFAGSGDASEGDERTAAYPLATTVSAAGASSTRISLAPELSRSVAVERIGDSEAVVERIAEAAAVGAAVAWVRNAVDDALSAANLLVRRGLEPLLFHARFAMADRLAIESEVLSRFGRDSTPAARRGQVLVATQVIEQSLDLDFDLLVSDLAPADLIIQRSGRLWRHPDRPRPIGGPRLLLFSPEPVADPPEHWLGAELRRTGVVYADHALVWRSARALLAESRIATPEGIRPLVEAAYDRDAPRAEPAGLERATLRAIGRWTAARGQAWQNLLALDHPYERRAGLWEPDARTPTRLGDPHLTFRLARVEGGRVVPWATGEDPAEAWALSEVSVRAARIAAAAGDPETEALITRAQASWPLWDRDIPVLVLRPGPGAAHFGSSLNQTNHPQHLSYDARRGLVFLPSAPPSGR